jgi:hypothetical protein
MRTFTIRTNESSTEHLSSPTKPRGRPPNGKIWCETTHHWIEDGLKMGPSPSAPPSTKPRGRPPNGKIWCETTHHWIEDGLKMGPSPSAPPSTKPRGRPPKGKVWCFQKNEWISKPKVSFVKRVGSNGQIKYVMKFIVTPNERPLKTPKASSSKAHTKGPKNVTISKPKSPHPIRKTAQTCTTSLNKFIHKQLMGGKITGVEEALREGGSLAYCNFDGICSAAENGKIGIFKMIFEKLDYTKLIDMALGIDLCETAEEEGHKTLATYLRSKLENLLDRIENENLDGLDNYV